MVRLRRFIKSLVFAPQTLLLVARLGGKRYRWPTVSAKGEILLSLCLPVHCLWVDHFESGVTVVKKTPHFKFVMDSMNNRKKTGDYARYLRRQYLFSAEENHLMARKFDLLVSSHLEGNGNFTLEVSLVGFRYPLVSDGFHRLSIVAAAGRQTSVRCNVSCFPLTEKFVTDRIDARQSQSKSERQILGLEVLRRAGAQLTSTPNLSDC